METLSKKTLVVCYALERDYIPELKDRLDRIDAGTRAVGWRSYAHVRDAQKWNFHNACVSDVMQQAFAQIAKADAVLLDLTSHGNSPRTGLNIEAGYAKALTKPIIALYQQQDRPRMSADIADYEAPYLDVSELEYLVVDLLKTLAA